MDRETFDIEMLDLPPPQEALVFGEEELPAWVEHAGSPLPDGVIREIEGARAAIPEPPGLSAHRGGHMYTGAQDRAHIAYLREHLTARAAAASDADRRRLLAFLAFQSREGSTAAINTYDNQIVTWGTGWGGLGWLPRVMERTVANDAARGALAAAGVRYRGKGIYDVVDLEARSVITGKREGLEAIRRSRALLCLLIDIARNRATRDAATHAQLTTFMEGSASIPCAEAVATQALFNFITHLKHWAPGYVMGCLEWAVPQASGGPSPERDLQLATLVGRYFYGKATRTKWVPDWRQFQIYFTRHMKEDGLDASADPFVRAASHPTDDPFAGAPLPAPAVKATAPATSHVTGGAHALAPAAARTLASSLFARRAELEAIAAGNGSLRQGARGAGVQAVQQALMTLGIDVPGGADGVFGRGLAAAVSSFQRARGLGVDGVVGSRTLRALDAALAARTGPPP